MQLKPVNLTWYPYDEAYKVDNHEQIRNLFFTGLTTGSDGIEFAFVPTTKIVGIHNNILTNIKKLKDYDTETEICSEVYWSTKIEGSRTTYERACAIHNGSPVDANNYFSEKMVEGGFNATKYMNIIGHRVSIKTLRQMWEILTDSCCDNYDIAGTLFRTGNVAVGKHVGLPPMILEESMQIWCNYFNSNTLDEYPFIKACLLHFAFAYVHPFCDGNGRSSRLLMNSYLISRGFDVCQAIAFSKEIGNNVQAYYAALETSENVQNDITPFVDFILSCMYNTVLNINDTVAKTTLKTYAKDHGQSFDDCIRKLSNTYGTAKYIALVDYLKQDNLIE